jgi:hypothetical protein
MKIAGANVLVAAFIFCSCGGSVGTDVGTDLRADVGDPDQGIADAVPGDAGRDVPDAAVDTTGDDGAVDAVPGDMPGDDVSDADAVPADAAADGVEPACAPIGAPSTVGLLAGTPLIEISGLAASRNHERVLWGHNDSGDTARIFALVLPESGGDTTSVSTVEFTLNRNHSRQERPGVRFEDLALDWEDIGIGPFQGIDGDAIFIADTGTNGAVRSYVRILVVPEPSELVPGDIADVRRFDFIYEDGLPDAESLPDSESMFVDRWTGDVYFVSKETRKEIATVYRLAAADFRGPHRRPLVARKVAQVPIGFATGADMSADGTLLVIRNYGAQKFEGVEFGGLLYRRTRGMTVVDMLSGTPCPLPNFAGDPWLEIQGEAITFTPDGSGFFTVAEFLSEVLPQQVRFWPLGVSR